MKIFLYLILGIIQGISEPLPISSSGHLVLAKTIFNVDTGGDAVFELVVHAGSLIAILLFYRKEITELFIGFFKELPIYFKSSKAEQKQLVHFNYGLKLIVATIPAGVVGLLFKKHFTGLLSNTFVVGLSLILTGVLLSLAHNTKPKYDVNKEPSYRAALFTGFAQIIALLPGVSRSGATNCANLIRGYNIKQAMKFSFFMFIPIATLAILSGIPDLLKMKDLGNQALPLLIAFVSSGVTTFFAMRLLLKVLEKRKLNYFAYYCFVVGTISTIISIGFFIFK